MVKKSLIQGVKSFIIGLCVSSLCVCSATYVNAASSLQSDDYYYYAGNNTYKNFSVITTGYSNGSAYAIADSMVNCNTAVPGGYMGVRPMLYNVYGNLIEDGGWDYLEESGYYGYGRSVSKHGVGNACYSRGWTASWNGSSYSSYQTYQSPMLSDFS